MKTPEEWIHEDYQAGLDVLKPSRRDLSYGLALHRESLVVESYGLGLHAPLDMAALQLVVDAGATPRDVADAVDEQRLTGWLSDDGLRAVYRQAWEASGVHCIFQNAGQEGNNALRQTLRLARHTHMVDAMPGFLQRATTPEAIVQAHADGKRCLYLTTNGVPLAGELLSPLSELLYIRVYAQLGVRMMHLTYNRRNLMGDGCVEPGDAGLSDFGRRVIAEMNRCGMIVDLAHSGLRTTIEAAEASTVPVVISHATVRALGGHLRGKTDAVIRAVVERGGTIGITNIPAFLGGSGDLAAFLDHIDYGVKAFGADAVTIGTDRPFKYRRTESLSSTIAAMVGQGQPEWENFWPPEMPGGEPLDAPLDRRPRQWASMNWTNWPLFTVGLVQRGYDDDAIRKIIGRNILRVARNVWHSDVNRLRDGIAG